jgi:hypothetical protein
MDCGYALAKNQLKVGKAYDPNQVAQLETDRAEQTLTK